MDPTPKPKSEAEAVDHELREKVIRMETRLAYLEKQAEHSNGSLGTLTTKIDDIRMDLHAAKIGGRWVIGAALALGSVLGWAVKLYLESKK